MFKIERVLPMQQTETEYFNKRRAEHGHEPVGARLANQRAQGFGPVD